MADWTTGKVGMTGTSYNGTIPFAVGQDPNESHFDLLTDDDFERGDLPPEQVRRLIDAAAAYGLGLVLIKPAALEAAGPRTQSFSPRVKEMFGVPSVAEAAALAAAGPDSTLFGPRTIVGPVTCAIAGTAPNT